MANKLILIVEDDDDIRESFSEIVSLMGEFDTLSAPNGKMALELLRNSQRLPDLILLDVLMPVLDGFGFRMQQLEDERLKSIPIIVLSASHRITDLMERMQARAYLKKPVDIDELMDVVKQFC